MDTALSFRSPNENVQVDLYSFEERIYSQSGEDGVIQKVFEVIKPKNGYFLEIGSGNGIECNTRNLRLSGWQGKMIDKNHENRYLQLHQEFVTASNVHDILLNLNVPREIDFLSIDVNGNDFYILLALNTDYWKILCVMIEFNGTIDPIEDKVMQYDEKFESDDSDYFGASLSSMVYLAGLKGYGLVWANKVNAMFVRNEFIKLFRNIDYSLLERDRGHHPDPFQRNYIPAKEAVRTFSVVK